MNPVAKILIIAGIILIIVGILWGIGGRFFNLGRLPGDIVVEKENMKFYFPIMTSIVISIVLSVVMYLIRLFK